MEIKINEKPTFDAMMAEQGGFGRFQIFGFLAIMMGVNANGWLGYGLVYVLLYPTYEC